MLIKTSELTERTGASFRQIDHWCRIGVISPIGNGCPGSGQLRAFPEEVVDRVKLLVQLSKTFGDANRRTIFKKLYARYDDKFIDLGDGVILTWGIDD